MIKFSIIICTYNREELLNNCLSSLTEQVNPPDNFEVIVVDNNSKDGTAELVNRYIKDYDNFRYVMEKNQGLSYARNRGCLEARGEYLVYLDDDAKATKKYLHAVDWVLNKYKPDLMGGPIHPYYTTKKPKWFKDKYEIREYAEKSGFSSKCQISGGNFTIKKTLLVELGMFDVKLGMIGNKDGAGEERMVLEKYRASTPQKEQRVYYSMDCKVLHHTPAKKMKVSYLCKRYYLGGKSLLSIKSDVNNKKYNWKSLVKFVWKSKIVVLKEVLKQHKIWKYGKPDYIVLLRLIFFKAGQIRAIVSEIKNR